MNLVLFVVGSFLSFHGIHGIHTCHYSCGCDVCEAALTTQHCPNEDDFCYYWKSQSGEVNQGCAGADVASAICDHQAHAQCWFCFGDLCNSFGTRNNPSLASLIVISSLMKMVLA